MLRSCAPLTRAESLRVVLLERASLVGVRTCAHKIALANNRCYLVFGSVVLFDKGTVRLTGESKMTRPRSDGCHLGIWGLRRLTGIQVRYSRDVRPNDLKNGTVILLGTQEGNPWVELFADRMNFRVVHNHQWARSRYWTGHPRDGEFARYDTTVSDPSHKIYGGIALLPNLGAYA